MEVFQAPTPIHQLHCQPVEQCWMRRQIPLHSKIFGSCDQACAKVRLPNAVHDRSGCCGSTTVDKPLGKRQARGLGALAQSVQELGHARLYLVRRL